MSRMLFKNTIRDIGRTKARFISIMLIIMLGVGFLVGIHSTAPSMYAAAQEYYTESNLMDFRLVSEVGFTEDDIRAIEEIEGIKDVMPSYFCDVLDSDEKAHVLRLIAMPESVYGDMINVPSLNEGRMPEKSDEALLGYSNLGIGDMGGEVKLSSANDNDNLSDTLLNTEFKITGIVDLPMYISFERGYTNVGNGKIYDYMLVPRENFLVERYTEVYLTIQTNGEVSPYSDEYDKLCEDFRDKLDQVSDLRIEAFLSENVTSAQSSIDEAEALLESKRAEAEAEISKAQKQIDDGKRELSEKTAEAERELATAKEKIDNGYYELYEQKERYYAEIKSAEDKIADSERELADAYEKIESAKREFMQTIYATLSDYGISQEDFEGYFGQKDMLTKEDVEQIISLVSMYEMSLNMQKSSYEQIIAGIEKNAEQTGTAPEDDPLYSETKAKLDEVNKTLSDIDEKLLGSKAQMLGAIDEIENAEAQLAKGKAELQTAKDTLRETKKQTEAQLAEAESTLENYRTEYDEGMKKLQNETSEAEQRLTEAQAELDSKRLEAEKEFADAETKIEDARSQLEKYSDPKWYIFDRSDNPGYSSYTENVERVNAVGKVFPVFFLLVAVLVCVTTMSRLVEEQRGDIGAITTLGYGKRDIMLKYVYYSAGASVIGAVTGIAVGVPVIPTVVMSAYSMLYSMPYRCLRLNILSAVIATVVAVICTSCVSVFTCYELLRHSPATLLRPKAPKPGKRILLERITFLWNKMSFFAKVTARNIFRYKARFLMTVIGVAGCTALIVSGLGLYSSITDVMDRQFGEIFAYDATIMASSGENDTETLREALKQDQRVGDFSLCRQAMVTVTSQRTSVNENVYIAVPENVADYEKIVNIRERTTGNKIEFKDKGCIITEKLANTLGVSIGDTVKVTDDSRTAELEITDIAENYLYGYVFVNPDTYRESFKTDAEYGLFMIKQSGEGEFSNDTVGSEYVDRDDVLGVVFISSNMETFRNMIQSLNYVVLVMVVCAAALAFVVLYNLSNINIAERKREISTLKVLGFKNSETSAYIYRENIVLTAVGILCGLLLGIWLKDFIVSTVEVNMVMFGRQLHASTFIISTLLTAVFSVAVNFVMHLRIKKIDMVESLKSVE